MSSATTDLIHHALSYHPARPQASSQLVAAVLGSLLGDAFGVPHEFKPGHRIPPAARLNLVMPEAYPRSHGAVPYGVWSDDGSQLLCVLETLNDHQGRINMETLGHYLLRWYDDGYHQAGGVVFDCGGQTRYVLGRLSKGVPVHEAALDATGVAAPSSNGNGSLMRSLPVGFVPVLWGKDEATTVELACLQSKVTHAHSVAQVSCAVHALLVSQLIARPLSRDWSGLMAQALAATRSLLPAQQATLETIQAYGENELPTGGGFVVNTLWSAVHSVASSPNYLEAIRTAVSFGNDTDTTACVAGGLAAIAYGLQSVPTDWWDTLVIPEESVALLRSFI